jgi:ParB-like nuclease domain
MNKITGTQNIRPDGPAKFELAEKEKGAPDGKGAPKQTAAPDANVSLKDLQPDSSLPTLAIHPEAQKLWEWLNVLPAKEASDLKTSIQAVGIQVPILMTKDRRTIIDGRNRWMIAQELGLKVKAVPVEEYQGKEEDIPTVIVSLNALRRHLTDEQRAAVVALVRLPQLEKEAKMRQKEGGGDKRSPHAKPFRRFRRKRSAK